MKAVIINDDGHVAGQSDSKLAISRPQALWSEQDPLDWWQSVSDAVLALPIVLRGDIKAIGLSGQMHGATLLDRSGKPLRPAILWNDGRSVAQCKTLQEGPAGFVERTGNYVMPGFTAPKLLWVQENEPSTFRQISKVLLPKDYVRYRLTGEFASDMSDAAGTLWLDVANRCWDTGLLAASGLNDQAMPTLYEGHQETGTLSSKVAHDWGMKKVPVIAGGSDNAAGALGAGVTSQGEAMLSLGTSGVIFVATNQFRANAALGVHAFCHALPERWHVMSVMLSAASCIDWACRLTGLSRPSDLLRLAETQASKTSNLLFLPYLSGERTPHNNPFATGVLFGATHASSAADIAQAVLEGVAFGLADGLDALLDTEIDVNAISVIGGGAQSAYWGRILATTFQRQLIYRDAASAGPAYGAARLARYSQLGGNWRDAFAAPTIQRIVDPDPVQTSQLNARRQKFKRLYLALQSEFIGE